MYYEGLREGLRAATGVILESFIRSETDDVVMDVVRKGELLQRWAVARIALMEAQAVEEVQLRHHAMGLEEVEKILDAVDWDEFFTIQEPRPTSAMERSMRLYQQGIVSMDEFTRARTVEQMYRNALEAMREVVEGDQTE